MTMQSRWFLRTMELVSLGAGFGDIPILSEDEVQDLLIAHYAGDRNTDTYEDAIEQAESTIIELREGKIASVKIKSKMVSGFLRFR